MSRKPYERSPTLDTVLMVEKFIKTHSGDYNRTHLWKKLPKKVMWQTYLVILEYLQNTNRVALDRNGIVGYIYNPALVKKYLKRPGLNAR